MLLEITRKYAGALEALARLAGLLMYTAGVLILIFQRVSRQVKMSEPTAVTMDVYPYVLKLFYAYWDRKPVRALGISLSGLTDLQEIQLSLFDKKEEKIALSKAVDSVRKRYGITSIFRLASLSQGGLLFDRANKIGGHEA